MTDSDDNLVSLLLNGFRKLCIKVSEAFYDNLRLTIENYDAIADYIETFREIGCFFAAVDKLKKNQFVFTDDIDSAFAQRICNSENVDEEVENYFFSPTDERANSMIGRCEMALEYESDKRLFRQIEHAYRNEHFQLACIGLFVLVDGVLSRISKNDATNFKTRVDTVRAKVTRKTRLTDLDKKTIVICLSLCDVSDSMFKRRPFSQEEPSELDRNWLLHGRADKDLNRIDFMKEIMFLDAICSMGEFRLPSNSEE